MACLEHVKASSPGRRPAVKAAAAKRGRARASLEGPASGLAIPTNRAMCPLFNANFALAENARFGDQRNVRGVLENARDPTGRTLRLLSCYQAVDVLRLVTHAPFFDKLRCDQNREEHHKSRFRADLMQWM